MNLEDVLHRLVYTVSKNTYYPDPAYYFVARYMLYNDRCQWTIVTCINLSGTYLGKIT